MELCFFSKRTKLHLLYKKAWSWRHYDVQDITQPNRQVSHVYLNMQNLEWKKGHGRKKSRVVAQCLAFAWHVQSSGSIFGTAKKGVIKNIQDRPSKMAQQV